MVFKLKAPGENGICLLSHGPDAPEILIIVICEANLAIIEWDSMSPGFLLSSGMGGYDDKILF